MVSEKFRQQLRQEAQQWQADGLIDESIYREIARRYSFEELDSAANSRFVMVLLGLGSVLLGLAVITIVAANWQVWPRELRVLLLVSLFIGVNTAGFYLWRKSPSSWQSRLGKVLLLLGGIILGANIALMSQMFHSSGAVYSLYLVWSFGVLAMAYSLRLTLLGMLALILAGLGYGLGISDLFRAGNFSLFQFLVQQMPLIASFLFVPLAYLCRSRWLFGLSVILAIFSLETNLIRQWSEFANLSTEIAGFTAAIACIIPPSLLWAYRDELWGLTPQFNALARSLGVIFLSILFYFFSFNFVWGGSPSPVTTEVMWYSFLPLVDAIILGGLAVYAWWRLGIKSDRRWWGLEWTSTLMATGIMIAGGVVWVHLSVERLGAIATLLFNLLLFLLAVGLLRQGVTKEMRRGFWGGILLLVLQLLTRMLEYETGLVFKAVVLFLCGITVIAAGLWFERYLHTSNEVRTN